MQTTDRRTNRHMRLLLALTGALVLAMAGTYAADGQWSTAAGVITGAGLVLALLAVADHRARTRGAEASAAARVMTGRGDEREQRVHLLTLTVVGGTALLATSLAPVAVHLGLDPETALRWLPYVLIATGVVAFPLIGRRA